MTTPEFFGVSVKWGVCQMTNPRIFGVCQHLTMCKTGGSVFHASAIMGLERSWKDITGVRYVHDDIRCYLKLD